MKTLTSITLVLIMGLFYMGCNDAGITPASEQMIKDRADVPFNGNWNGTVITLDPEAYPLPKYATCQGNCTHLGLFSAEVNYLVTYNGMPPTGGTMINGSVVMVAANGDKMFLSDVSGIWWFTGPESVEFSATGNVNGGTGRFVNAAGSFSGTGGQVFYVENIPQETWFTWTGTMNY